MSDNQAKNLEDFIEKYIQNKAKSETAESYRAWLEKREQPLNSTTLKT